MHTQTGSRTSVQVDVALVSANPMVQYFMHNENHFQMYLNVYIFTGYDDSTA